MSYAVCLVTCVFVILNCCVHCLDQVMIPNHLKECYTEPKPILLPMTMSVLVEIIRKVELSPGVAMDMRMMANSLIHKDGWHILERWECGTHTGCKLKNLFQMDGIERDPDIMLGSPGIIPYRTSGFQLHKFSVLIKHLLPGNSMLFPNNSLSVNEMCTLHFMLSSSVDPWERPDERQACPNSYQDLSGAKERFHSKFSRCPIELGVVSTPSGTVNAGTLLASIVSALEPLQLVQTNAFTPAEKEKYSLVFAKDHSIKNIWAATLAGDLAEIILFQMGQVDKVILGLSGHWNDSYIPKAYYFNNLDYADIVKGKWHMTDAEILAGIDGLIIGEKLQLWLVEMSQLRLSQLLELYYLGQGVCSDPENRACNREKHFTQFMSKNSVNLVNQTQHFAELLSMKVHHYFVDNKFIKNSSQVVSAMFQQYYPKLLRNKKCPQRTTHTMHTDVTIVLDATWPKYTALQLLMDLVTRLDVSYYGSRITVISGNGAVLVNKTGSIADVYLQWNNSPFQELGGLSLGNSFLTVKQQFENAMETTEYSSSRSPVVLILGYSSTISDKDLELSKSLLISIKASVPTVKFVYFTSIINTPRYVKLTGVPGSQNDNIVATEDALLTTVMFKLEAALASIPRRMTAVMCTNDTEVRWSDSVYTEYVSPEQSVQYWIHPDYFCDSDDYTKVTLKNFNYGTVRMCVSRDSTMGDCKNINTNEEVTSFIVRPCHKEGEGLQQWDPGCLPAYITVLTDYSFNQCTEDKCRYPDQVKFKIIIQGLRCTKLFQIVCQSSATSSRKTTSYLIILHIIVFMYYLLIIKQ